jgi:signal transduction histidine kinase
MTQRRRGPSLLGLEDDGRDLFGVAAHKLNTPITCLRGFITTLQQRGDQLDADTVQQFHAAMLAHIERLQGMVRDFLALARVQGGIEPMAHSMHPRDLLIELIDDLGSDGARVRAAGDLDLKVCGDAELVRMALRPLVENAVIYGPRAEPVVVTVSVGEQRIRWEVRDRGQHLPPDQLEQLFRPFMRADAPVERRGSGAGLGLTLARAYAEALQGQVGGAVDGEGTVFWLDLPVLTTEEMAS